MRSAFHRNAHSGSGFGAGELVEVVGGVWEIGADGDGLIAAAQTPVCSDNRGEGGDSGQRILFRILGAAETQNGRGHAEGIHGRSVRGGSVAEEFDRGGRESAPRGQIAGE